jgi:NAD(P)-dependent dehydrogenase (short-subunit alcohol dehydrogenase family)
METAGTVDVLIANLMARNNRRTADQIDDADWRRMFDVMVHPLYRLARPALPQMLARGRGKIVVIGRANGLRGTSIRSAYSAARGAQIAYVRAVDAEVAARGSASISSPRTGSPIRPPIRPRRPTPRSLLRDSQTCRLDGWRAATRVRHSAFFSRLRRATSSLAKRSPLPVVGSDRTGETLMTQACRIARSLDPGRRFYGPGRARSFRG